MKIFPLLLLIPFFTWSQKPKLVNVTLGHLSENKKITLIIITKNTRKISYNSREHSPKFSYKKYQVFKFVAPVSEEQKLVLQGKDKKVSYENLFPANLSVNDKKYKFLLGSCLLIYPNSAIFGHFNNGVWKQLLKNAAKENADFNVWLGDNIYLFEHHWKSKQNIALRYTQYRKKKNLPMLLKARPNYAVWDDHEFGPNDSGKEFKGKDKTLEMFNLFWGNPAAGTPEIPGIFFSMFKHQTLFLFLDERYYRTMEDFSEGKIFLGEKQLQWIEREIKKYNPRLLIVLSGSQVLNDKWKSKNVWSFFEEEQEKFFDILRRNKVPNVIFFSGDRHRAEFLKDEEKLGFPIYEITVSPLTSFIRYAWLTPKAEKENPKRIGKLMHFYNYGVCEVNWQAENPYVLVEIKNRRGKTRRTLKISLR